MKKAAAGKSEASRIADQLQRAFHGSAWHGPAVIEILEEVDSTTAAAKPLPDVHSIWELLLHIEAWDRAAIVRMGGEKYRVPPAKNFPRVTNRTDAAWRKAISQASGTHDELVRTVANLPDSRLRDRVPGKKYDFYHMLHGVVQHELYHGGQIAILKKAAKKKRKAKG